MSGPKSSRYRLTPEQRRILLEQRMLERRRAVAKEKIKRGVRSIHELEWRLSDKRRLSELIVKATDDRTLSDAVAELDAVICSVKETEAGTDYDNVDALEALERKTGETLCMARELYRKIETLSEDHGARLRSQLNEAIDGGFEHSFADIKPTKNSELDSLRRSATERLESLKGLEYISRERREEISRAIDRLTGIDSVEFLKNYVAVTVTPLEGAVRAECEEHLRCRDEYEALYVEYRALCNMAYLVAVDFPCTDGGISALKAEIERIRTAMDKSAEQDYIAECLDEVMREMGYSVIGSRAVKKRNGRHFRNELYRYGEGTAVNVTYSSDGRISMELGGIDGCDRLPSEQESVFLCGEMETFCGDFGEIERRLQKKGVVLDERISLLPPDTGYAQIINTNDYEMKAEAERLSVRKKQLNRAKAKAKKQE